MNTRPASENEGTSPSGSPNEALDAWRAPPSGRPGGQRRYADIAIEAAHTVRMAFHLPLRQTEGFLRSLAQRLDVDLPGAANLDGTGEEA